MGKKKEVEIGKEEVDMVERIPTLERNYEEAGRTWEMLDKERISLYEDLEFALERLGEAEEEYDRIKAKLEKVKKEVRQAEKEMERARSELCKAQKAKLDVFHCL